MMIRWWHKIIENTPNGTREVIALGPFAWHHRVRTWRYFKHFRGLQKNKNGTWDWDEIDRRPNKEW